jgi:hypothetical protein
MVCEAGFHRGKHIPRQLPIQVATDFGELSRAVADPTVGRPTVAAGIGRPYGCMKCHL